MCITIIEKCTFCDTHSALIYRCIDKLKLLHLESCGTKDRVYYISELFMCDGCILRAEMHNAKDLILERYKVKYELEKESLTTTGTDSYVLYM